MRNEPLFEVVVQAILFFEFSDDDTCDPDSACSMLEGIAGHLKDLDSDSKEEFFEFLKRRAAGAELENVRTYLVDLPSVFGLPPEPE